MLWTKSTPDYEPLMHRLTASSLLALLLVGTFAPAALAVSAPPPHACCLRKPIQDHGAHHLEVQAVDGERHNCCPPITTAHWAEIGSDIASNRHSLLTYLPPQPSPALRSNFENALRPVRGPPLA